MNGSTRSVLTLAVTLAWLAAEPVLAGGPSLSPNKSTLQPVFPGVGGVVFPLPDLVVTRFEATGPAKLTRDGYFTLPVRFDVDNQGSRPAGAFKVSAHYFVNRPGAKMRLVKFTTATPGQKPGWFAWSGPLGAGDRFTQRGTVSLPRSLAGQTIKLYLLADSTASEEFARKNGRVAETSEKNNWSEPTIRLRLSLLRPDTSIILRLQAR